jgi:hypothetical protein
MTWETQPHLFVGLPILEYQGSLKCSDMENKRLVIWIVGVIALLAVSGIGILLWMQFSTATVNGLPDPLAKQMAPIDPCGCAWGASGNETYVPLGLTKTKELVDAYLQHFNNPNLELKEIVVFNNNSYARIAEKSSGTNAMELIVDTETDIVLSEYGSSFTWNVMYPSIPDSKTIGNIEFTPSGPVVNPAENPLAISSQQAKIIAQQYLKQYKINVRLSKTVETFSGYYVIENLHWGKVVGMISINGYTGQAFRHDWHQTFIARMTY